MRLETMRSRHGRGRAAAVAAVLVLLPAAAGAQQLWSVGDVSRAPEGPAVVMEGSAVGAGSSGFAGMPVPVEAAEVQVEFDYLRLGMGYLELPLPNGSTIAAENAVFEDRGDGNLMWTGEVPGAGYESVVFTVQDGHLVGWFGEPGGPKYVVYAGPDGRGSLAEEVGPTGDWCGVGDSPGRDLVRRAAAGSASSRPASAASGSSDDRLDILVLYTTGTERFLRVIGGPAVGVRRLGDYLNMVFRNGEIPATANLIPVRWDPDLFHHPETQGRHYLDFQDSFRDSLWHWEFQRRETVATYMRRYKPDLVHFIRSDSGTFVASRGELRGHLSPLVLSGFSFPFVGNFAHEIGHNLGALHSPEQYRDFEEVQARSMRPYIFGHGRTPCAKAKDYKGQLPYWARPDTVLCPSTIMSVSTRASSIPGARGVGEPFYSSVRHKPNGWTIGVAGKSEVEKLFYETVPVQARSGEAPWSAEQRPRRVTGARWTGHGTVRVTWSEDCCSQGHGFPLGSVLLALAEGANDSYTWSNDLPPHGFRSDDNVTPILRSDGSQVGVDIAGLRPGGRYKLSVAAWGGGGGLSSDIFRLKPPGRASGSPAAATEVGALVTGPDSVRLHWRDNSRVETGFEVWYRDWSAQRPDNVWRRYGDPLPARTRHVDVKGLAAYEGFGSGGRYSLVVVAYNDKGWNASDTFNLEFMPGPHPELTAAGEFTDCDLRDTGLDLDGFDVSACLETPDGARRRAWDYQLDADQSGLLYFFDRDNAEILVKVLDGCAINGHRWVFVAPVTTLPFRLAIYEDYYYPAGRGSNRRGGWYYDSERRPQDGLFHLRRRVGNPKDRTARTVSDTTAFPCTVAETAAAKVASAEDTETLGAADLAAAAAPRRLSVGSRTDCEPGGPTLGLRGGYTVSMCYERYDGQVGDAKDWGLDSSQSGLLYFFDRNNAEVLIKVLDGCGVNGHRWVFVAPVTDLAFNLIVESPSGERWTHANQLGRTADAASDVRAFPCSSSA